MKSNDPTSCASLDVNSVNLASFAFNLFSLLVTPESTNVLISPFSIASALALVLAGTTIDSICQSQIQNVLNIGHHSDLPIISNHLLQSSKASGIELESANGIWTSTSIKTGYINTIEEVHDSKVDTLPKSFDLINEFVSQKTNGMIDNLLQGDIDPLTVAVLINAVYFKGIWKEQFDNSKTIKGTFHTIQSDGSIAQREAMLMKANRQMNVGIDIKSLGGAHGVLMEYRGKDDKDITGSEFGALFLLPSQNSNQSMQRMISGLSSFFVNKKNNKNEETMSLQNLIQNEFQVQKVDLTLPRFRVSYGVKSLKKELKNLGMTEAFDGRGVFSEMSDDELVHLDDVYHKASMEVTEEGTMAAAATGAVMMTRSIVMPFEMKFDRPFVIMVVHLKTGMPLFIGKIHDPDLMY